MPATERDPVMLSVTEVGTSRGSRTIPPVLVQLAVPRVRILAAVMLGIMLLDWMTLALEGNLLYEFQRAGEWVPSTVIIVASLGMLALTRVPRLSASSVLAGALAYEVVVSWGIAYSTYWDTFASMTLIQMEDDIIGFTGVAIWMMFFTVMVPAQPRRALAALVASATAVPVVYLFEVHAGRAPALSTGQMWALFVGPYLLVAGLAYFGAHTIYRLGMEVTDAMEMGSYRLVQRLGAGGMGEVWRAQHRMLARPAAVKLIHREALGANPSHAEQLISRFEREAQVTASLQSPHTVELYDFGRTEDGTCYYVMELLEGVDLEALVRRFGPVPAERAVHVLRQVCASLDEAHRRGLVHRDVKPANVYLCQRAFRHDFVKVLDFGLVKWHDAAPRAEDLHLSKTGIIHGTPSYMAPEVISGEGPVDGRADLYAVGCLAYWLLTGRLVFEERTFPAMLVAHSSKQPQPPSRHAEQPVPPALDAVVLSCLQKDPAARVQNAAALAKALDEIPFDTPWTQERAAAWWEERREAS